MNVKINVTGTRCNITKSRSGHYTLVIKDVGTWEKDGRTYPYENTVLKRGKIELATAQYLKKEFMDARKGAAA